MSSDNTKGKQERIIEGYGKSETLPIGVGGSSITSLRLGFCPAAPSSDWSLVFYADR